MSEQPQQDNNGPEAEVLARRILLVSTALLLLLALCGWLLSGWFFARSVCLGGILASASFWMMKRDIQGMMARLVNDTGPQSRPTGLEQGLFMLKSFARLGILVLLLVVLANKVSLHVLGLLLGLSTIMVSVIIVGLRMGKASLPSKV